MKGLRMPLGLLAIGFLSCAPEVPLGSGSAALTAEQCEYFAQNGRVTLCNPTGSATNPFVPVRVPVSACANAFADKEDAFVSQDGTCDSGNCLPLGAPCDETLGCCDGNLCTDGVCQAPQDPCPPSYTHQADCSCAGPEPDYASGSYCTCTTKGCASPVCCFPDGDGAWVCLTHSSASFSCP